MKKIVSTLLILTSNLAFAETIPAQLQEKMDNQRMQENPTLEKPEPQAKPQAVNAQAHRQSISISSQQLLQQPELLNSAMLTALVTNHTEMFNSYCLFINNYPPVNKTAKLYNGRRQLMPKQNKIIQRQ